LEHRAGFEPANAGFADLCVSHFATGAIGTVSSEQPVVPTFHFELIRLQL
jgi:hypothetical protein